MDSAGATRYPKGTRSHGSLSTKVACGHRSRSAKGSSPFSKNRATPSSWRRTVTHRSSWAPRSSIPTRLCWATTRSTRAGRRSNRAKRKSIESASGHAPRDGSKTSTQLGQGADMSSHSKKLIAVIGATGQQGGAVVRALQAQGQSKVRPLTRNPGKHRGLGDEVVEADLDRPESLEAAFAGAHGVFLVTNFWEPGTDERKQATAAVRAAKEAGVKHFIWSTLPDVEAISGGKLHVPHFTGKAKIDRIVKEAGFAHHTFVIAPFFYQNLVGLLAPQKQEDGTLGWAVPVDPAVRVVHMGDITE